MKNFSLKFRLIIHCATESMANGYGSYLSLQVMLIWKSTIFHLMNCPLLHQIFLQQDKFHHPLQWPHNERGGVSNHQPHDCLLKCSFRCRSTKTSKLHITDLCEGNSPFTGEFPAQRASNAEIVSIWWRHHDFRHCTSGNEVTMCRFGQWPVAHLAPDYYTHQRWIPVN